MTLRISMIRKLTGIVGPERVLMDPEDLYVYSFERVFEDVKYSNFDAVVRTNSKDKIAEIEQLAKMEGLTIIHRGKKAVVHEPQEAKRSGTILLDTAPRLEIAAFDVKIQEGFGQLKECRQKLMDTLRKGPSYKGLALAVESLFHKGVISQCKDCEICTGFCTVSPTFNYVETYSAKGRHLLMRGLMRGELKPSKRLADILYSCTLCGLCYAQCTPDLHLDKAILEARGRMTDEGLAPESAKIALRNVLDHGNPMGASRELRVRWMRRLPQNLLEKRADALYWAGCNTTLRSGVRSTANATVKVLSAAGINLMTLGEREGCCGFSLVVGGLFEEAKRNAEQVAREVDEAGVEMLVTSCSGCYETFTDFYPNRLGVEIPCPVFHSSQLLIHQAKNRDLRLNRLPLKVTYHDPCGLGRHCGIYDPPRRLLKSIPDLQLIEPDLSRERSRCCGGGGGLWGVDSGASMSLAIQRIREDIMPLDTEALAVSCPLCHTNFLYTLKRHGIDMRVYDIVEFVEMALRNRNTD